MKPKSAIQKGKNFENWIADQIEEAGLGRASRTPGSGSGNRHKGEILANIPFLIEAKNHASLKWHPAIDQAKSQAEIGNWDSKKWALVVKDFRSPENNPEAYALIDFHEFLKLLKKDAEPLVKEPDRNLKYKLGRLKQAAQEVIKEL